MANVDEAYCAIEDLRTGDLPAPFGSTKEQYIKSAAEEIDGALGHVYVTPFVIQSTPKNRPTILTLKKLNWLLASGRFILDVAVAGEQRERHAYGKSLLEEAQAMLAILRTGNPLLEGAETIEPEEATEPTGPIIHNEDAMSLVENFYQRAQDPFFGYPWSATQQAVPYGN